MFSCDEVTEAFGCSISVRTPLAPQPLRPFSKNLRSSVPLHRGDFLRKLEARLTRIRNLSLWRRASRQHRKCRTPLVLALTVMACAPDSLLGLSFQAALRYGASAVLAAVRRIDKLTGKYYAFPYPRVFTVRRCLAR